MLIWYHWYIGRHLKRWKKRWFVLQDSTLYSFQKEKVNDANRLHFALPLTPMCIIMVYGRYMINQQRLLICVYSHRWNHLKYVCSSLVSWRLPFGLAPHHVFVMNRITQIVPIPLMFILLIWYSPWWLVQKQRKKVIWSWPLRALCQWCDCLHRLDSCNWSSDCYIAYQELARRGIHLCISSLVMVLVG